MNGANIGFEEKLWESANQLRSTLDPAEYKYLVLGLLFLKFASNFGDHKVRQQPASYKVNLPLLVLEEKSNTVWEYIKGNSDKENLGQIIDESMELLEKQNPSLNNILPKVFARSGVDHSILAGIVRLFDEIKIDGDSKNDVLGRVYEYFIGKFAGAEGNGGGEYFTPQSVVKLLVNMIEPYKGKIYDPCCGSGGMFVQSERFVEEHGGKTTDITIYGQELNPTTWRLCKMNLMTRGLEGDLGLKNADSFKEDLHSNLKADFILANPPFNISSWGGEKLTKDERWIYGVPPTGNANYAWVQHIIHHLTADGQAGFVLSNGSLAGTHGKVELDIRRSLIEGNIIDCIVSLPNQLFYNTQIAASLWFISKNKKDPNFKDRSGKVLFIYAQDLGKQVDRIHRELTDQDIALISDTYHEWRKLNGKYSDILGFCKESTIQEIETHKWALVPGRYVGFSSKDLPRWDTKQLRQELEEAEDGAKKINSISNSVIKVLKEIIYG